MSRLRVAMGRDRGSDGRQAARLAFVRTGASSSGGATTGRPCPSAAAQARPAGDPMPSARSSIAHCGGVGAAATVPDGWRVGIDIEPRAAVRPGELRFFLTRAEREAAREFDITALWCLKEAAWKAFGCAPSLPFKALELVFARESSGLRVVAVRIDEGEPVAVQSAVRVVHGSWIVATVAVRARDVATLTSSLVDQWPAAREGTHAC